MAIGNLFVIHPQACHTGFMTILWADVMLTWVMFAAV
jgi:hypothetical protein